MNYLIDHDLDIRDSDSTLHHGTQIQQGTELRVIKHCEAKHGFVLLTRRWAEERSFAWAARFRRLTLDYERLASYPAGFFHPPAQLHS